MYEYYMNTHVNQGYMFLLIAYTHKKTEKRTVKQTTMLAAPAPKARIMCCPINIKFNKFPFDAKDKFIRSGMVA